MSEADRIRAEYARRADHIGAGFYSPTRPSNLFAQQQRNRHALRLLEREHVIPLGMKAILDIGCGEGQQLIDLESWGARRANLAGIDLIDSRVERARERLGVIKNQPGGGADLRV